ncbi:Coiled-coil domain-containing protein 151 [Trichoplax sp. H2]|uniref:ODAD1 central coiled coil region domain-containing protein n=1 Tax=Trichoplax adhaerens TaxID=10228 RepID=B3RP65_TRIAD|nr:hypothetical protein TRIADDRAFT_53420 [Trichoplax adhaerens]EDV28138.1 hypothetical protein TRIADDRAFT_53420 [Trichoplax adhaerens]RDD45454.1 Coiled-coil domain-containing protein 151 [Trichoplax sp. H2]|eukprot:XP_002109972.1 hypothetical protein TRIADDRAFT_53420 [Trichoplax adhaerens]
MTVTDEIEELKRKISLLDGDRKAYYESSQWTMKKNKEIVSKLRRNNRELRLELAKKLAGDERVVEQAFSDRKEVRLATKGMASKTALSKMDQKVCETRKRYNAMHSERLRKESELEELQKKFGEMLSEYTAMSKTDLGESAEGQTLRMLENRLDKAELKITESQRMHKTYILILEKLKEERQTFPNELDTLEKQIKHQKMHYDELQATNRDAQIARDSAKSELSKLESSTYDARRDREGVLAKYKKQAEEKKSQHEKVEKRLQRASLQSDDLIGNLDRPTVNMEEQERKITTYEDAMRKIKDATGVSDIKEVVQRFLSQGNTQQHLLQLKSNNEKTLVRLREEKEKLQEEFETMKYSGEAKLSSGERMLEEFQAHLGSEETRYQDAKVRQERAARVLVNVKAGIEHLADKLAHIKVPKGHVPQAQLSPTSDEYTLDLLGTCEQKLLKLMEELDGRDMKELEKQMELEEYHSTLVNKLPQHNTRIKLPVVYNNYGIGDVYDEEEDSGEDEDIVTRDALKRQSQLIVDSKTKKKIRSKKKKK